MPLKDLSIPLADGMDAFPDEPTARFTPFSTLSNGGIEMWNVTLFSQLGTHVDAPSHFIDGGGTVERLDLDACIGECIVVDVPEAGSIEVAHLLVAQEALRQARRVILRSGWSRHAGTPGYWHGHPTLSVAAAEYLVALGIRFIGFDVPTPSVENLHEVHIVLLGAGVVIAECLVNLAELPERVEVICLPLPLVGLDGAPARTIARY